MKRPIAFLYVLGLFVLGILIGALGAHLHYAHQFPPRPDLMRPGAMRGDHFFERLERHLDLTEEQKLRIEEILRDSQVESRALHEEMMPRVHEHMQRTRDRIADVLTPEQFERFEELHRSHRGMAERFFLGHGPRKGRGPGSKGRQDRESDSTAPDDGVP